MPGPFAAGLRGGGGVPIAARAVAGRPRMAIAPVGGNSVGKDADEGPAEQDAGQHDGGEGEGERAGDHQPVARLRGAAALVLLEQLYVPEVGLEEHVGEIARDGDGADERVEGDVDERWASIR
jgi:hypothetical protein